MGIKLGLNYPLKNTLPELSGPQMIVVILFIAAGALGAYYLGYLDVNSPGLERQQPSIPNEVPNPVTASGTTSSSHNSLSNKLESKYKSLKATRSDGGSLHLKNDIKKAAESVKKEIPSTSTSEQGASKESKVQGVQSGCVKCLEKGMICIKKCPKAKKK